MCIKGELAWVRDLNADEAIRGWREWRLERGPLPYITPRFHYHQSEIWKENKEVYTTSSPRRDENIGFHAVLDPRSFFKYAHVGWYETRVCGVVEGFGVVAMNKYNATTPNRTPYGFRASKMSIVSLIVLLGRDHYTDLDLPQQLSQRYQGVMVYGVKMVGGWGMDNRKSATVTALLNGTIVGKSETLKRFLARTARKKRK